MAKAPPSFNLYPGDLIKSCIEMAADEFGAYMRLLCYQWEHGAVPCSVEKLARICGVDRSEFPQIWEAIGDRFEDEEDDNLEVMVKVQSRLKEQRAKDIEVWQARKAGGKLGGRPKRKGGESREKRKPRGLGGGSLEETSRVPSTEKGKGKREESLNNKDVSISDSDDWVFPDGWDTPELRSSLDDWAAMRKRIKKPVKSLEGASKIFKHFDSPEHLAYAAEFCEANEYQGLKPDYRPSSKSDGGGSKQKTFTQMRVENTQRAIEEAMNYGER